jgi:catechol 2,3-dioxygenase-like lactoylglutathione lyase family enzyme
VTTPEAGPEHDLSAQDDTSGRGRLHDVRVPVSDAWVSRDWYTDVLGFVAVLDLEVEDALVGVVMRSSEGLVLGLHQDPAGAQALKGFALLGFLLDDVLALRRWASELDRRHVPHASVLEGHRGWYLDVPDPDGILVRFHTNKAPFPEEA